MPTPHHVVTLPIGGHPVRFHASPRDVPDFPWFAYVDMLAVMELPREGWQLWLDRARDVQTELTHDLPDGTMLVPTDAGVGLLLWGRHHGWDRVPQLTSEWDDALHPGLWGEALKQYLQLAALHVMPAGEIAH